MRRRAFCRRGRRRYKVLAALAAGVLLAVWLPPWLVIVLLALLLLTVCLLT